MATSTLPYSDLAQQANQFMTGQAIAPYLANLPNYANMVGQRTENISQQLSGQLPQDVINQISQQAAERGVSSGTAGSPNANSAYLRALGLNSLQMQQQGNQNLSGAINDTPVPQLFNPMSLIVPEMMADREMRGATTGQALARRQSGANAGSVNQLGGMPSLGFGTGARTPFSTINNGAALSGPSWGTGGGNVGTFNSPTFANGMYMGGGGGGGGGGYSAGGGGTYSMNGTPFSTGDFNPYWYGGSGGNSVDWSSLYQDESLPAGWADQDWGGAFGQIDASNPDNAFMFE